MNICTITCHNVYNAGASLQAYALVCYLRSLGHNVCIIDYYPYYYREGLKIWCKPPLKYNKFPMSFMYCLYKMPIQVIKLLGGKKKKFDEFTNKYLPLTERFSEYEELRQNCPKADVFICGSDQIWNSYGIVGKDPAYYLEFASDRAIKISYAASFSTDSINSEYRLKIINWLKRFDAISCREKSGVQILEKCGIRNAVLVLDPVFLVDAETWLQMGSKRTSFDNYLLVYDFDNNPLIRELALRIAARDNLKIISFQKLSYSDSVYSDYGPLEFISMIYNAKCVISNSFHATAFSIVFNKLFYVVKRKEDLNARIIDLLKELDLTQCMIESVDSNLPSEINYSKVNEKLKQMIRVSKEFLNTSIMRGIDRE